MSDLAMNNWQNGSKLAVSIVYSGSRSEHLEIAAPLLYQLGLQATFFVEPSSVLDGFQGWKQLREQGHEFGNGALTGFSEDGALSNWTHAAVSHEIVEAQVFLKSELQVLGSGFVFPGSNPVDGQGSYAPMIEDLFEYGIGFESGANDLAQNPHNLKSVQVTHYPSEWLSDDFAPSQLTWLIIRFEELLNGESNNAILVHRLVVEAIHRMKQRAWVAPAGTVFREFKRLQDLNRLEVADQLSTQ